MAHRRLLVDRVLVVAWRAPEEDDILAISAQVAEDHARLGRPLLYQSVIGKRGIPQGRARDLIVGFYATLLDHCDSMHIVIEGSEFEQSIKRSVIANVMLKIDTRGRIFVEGTLDRVQQVSPLAVRAELVRAAQVAEERHLFDFARAENEPA